MVGWLSVTVANGQTTSSFSPRTARLLKRHSRLMFNDGNAFPTSRMREDGTHPKRGTAAPHLTGRYRCTPFHPSIPVHRLLPSGLPSGHSPSLSLTLQQGQDIIDLDWALDVSDDGSGGVIHEFDTDLGDTTTGTGSTEDLEGRNSRQGNVSIRWMDKGFSTLDDL